MKRTLAGYARDEQLYVAMRADTTQRHLSFFERGRVGRFVRVLAVELG